MKQRIISGVIIAIAILALGFVGSYPLYMGVLFCCPAFPVNLPAGFFFIDAGFEYRDIPHCLIKSAAVKGQTEEKNLPILIRDCYGKGQMITFVVPDNFTDLQYLPKEVLNAIRREFCDTLPVHIECGKNVGLFLYDNDTMIVYPYEYLNEGPQPCFIHVKGEAKKLVSLSARWKKEYEPIAEIPENKMLHTQKETVFKIETFPDVFDFIKIER